MLPGPWRVAPCPWASVPNCKMGSRGASQVCECVAPFQAIQATAGRPGLAGCPRRSQTPWCAVLSAETTWASSARAPPPCQALGQAPGDRTWPAQPSSSPSCSSSWRSQVRGTPAFTPDTRSLLLWRCLTIPDSPYSDPSLCHPSTGQPGLWPVPPPLLPWLVSPLQAGSGFALSVPCLFLFAFGKLSKDANGSRRGWTVCRETGFS